MKTYAILAAAALVATATMSSCQKTDASQEKVTLTLNAQLGTPGTRLTLGDDGLRCKWADGDQVVLFSTTGTETYTFELESISDDGLGAYFVYNGEAIPEGTYRAAAGLHSWTAKGDGVFSFSIPTSQTYYWNDNAPSFHTDNNPFLAEATVTVSQQSPDLGAIVLKPALALLEIQMMDENIARLTLNGVTMQSNSGMTKFYSGADWNAETNVVTPTTVTSSYSLVFPIAYPLSKREYATAHMLLLPTTVTHVLFVFDGTHTSASNYVIEHFPKNTSMTFEAGMRYTTEVTMALVDSGSSSGGSN